MSLVKFKDFNVLIENNPFFDQLVNNKQKVYEKPIEMSRNNDFSYHQNYYKLIGIDLSRQTNTNIPKQIKSYRKSRNIFIAKMQ